jgi:hypothetical protein
VLSPRSPPSKSNVEIVSSPPMLDRNVAITVPATPHRLLLQAIYRRTLDTIVSFLLSFMKAPVVAIIILFSIVVDLSFTPIEFDSIRFDSIRFDSIRFNSIQFNSIQFNSIRFTWADRAAAAIFRCLHSLLSM